MIKHILKSGIPAEADHMVKAEEMQGIYFLVREGGTHDRRQNEDMPRAGESAQADKSGMGRRGHQVSQELTG